MSKQNHLANETSPYLLQHVDNLVDWYPWCQQAIKKAKKEHKPILLSIGYSACHWCHVMAHESFEDPETAQIMNKHYINIKVDREERPDIDRIYQTAYQLLFRKEGGWPLTMILMPGDQIPFFGGTYFPLTATQGMPSFKELLIKIHDYFIQHEEEIKQQNHQLSSALQQITETTLTTEALDDKPIIDARTKILAVYDAQFGGFGMAPKFPNCHYLYLLIMIWFDSNKKDEPLRKIVENTLDKMAAGGIRDHIGGGFHRYSIDGLWMIPHFEKMLYDNAQLLDVYSQAAVAFNNDAFAEIAKEIATFIIRDMQDFNGGFYTAIDADSENTEGKFYVWDRHEIKKHLTQEEYPIFLLHYGLHNEPNFEGHWHCYLANSIEDVAQQLQLSTNQVEQHLQQAKRKLFSQRKQRIAPGRDDKVITTWNALTIKAMAQAGFYLKNDVLSQAAEKNYDFLLQHLWNQEKLYASIKDGKLSTLAFLDDYAYLIEATLVLLQISWDSEKLLFAKRLADYLCQHFEDKNNGGFFFTADNYETLIQRPKPLMDDAIPSGNAIATIVLQRLGYLLGESYYLETAERVLQAAWEDLKIYPHAHPTLLLALEEYLHPPKIIVLRGASSALATWRQAATTHFDPHRLVYSIAEDIADLPSSLQEKTAKPGEVIAYICQGTQCEEPITDRKLFIKRLNTL